MELGGPEKRIQALFSELSLADHRLAPRFQQLWTRAEATKPAPSPSRSFAIAAAVVIIAAAFSFALWSTQSQVALNIAALEIPTSALPRVTQLAVVVELPRSQPSRQKRTVKLRQTAKTVITDVALLSSWQSPTQSLMQSPSSVGFNSLPQLNQSAKDLESFLPKKESNQ
jgi:uncharacterized membrane protein